MNDEHERLIADLRATVDDALAQIDALLAGAGAMPSSADGRASPSVAVGGSDLDLAPRTGFLDRPMARGLPAGRASAASTSRAAPG